MKNKVINALLYYNMLNNTDTIVVGLSGGADSISLIHCLNIIKNDYNINIVATHINHNLRGEEAISDELFVRDYCNTNNIPLEVLSVNIIDGAKKACQSVELYSRNIRYDFFNEISNKYKNAKIATAHTLSDNVETVIYNLTRGSGINGMCGIPPTRDNIIRPLIECTRDDIEKYCKENSLKYVTDSTNLVDIYTRNKIRNRIIPNLKEINNQLEYSVLKLSKSARENQEYIENQVEINSKNCEIKKNLYDCIKLKKLDKLILNNFIINIFKNNNFFNFNSTHILEVSKIIKNEIGAVDLPQNKRAIVKQGKFRIVNQKIRTENWQTNILNLNNLTKNDEIYNFKVVNLVEYKQIAKNDKKLLNNSLNYDIINGDTLIRNRRSKDIFTCSKRNVTKTIKKLFNELEILQENRDNILLIANDHEVLWIDNIGVSKFAKITKETKQVLLINKNDSCKG